MSEFWRARSHYKILRKGSGKCMEIVRNWALVPYSLLCEVSDTPTLLPQVLWHYYSSEWKTYQGIPSRTHGTQILLYRMGHAICPIAILVVQTGNIWLFCITPFGLFWGISIANKYSYCEGEGCLWSDSIAILVVQTGEHLAYLFHTIRRRGPVFFVGNYRTHRWRCDPYCELFLKLCSGFEEEKNRACLTKKSCINEKSLIGCLHRENMACATKHYTLFSYHL